MICLAMLFWIGYTLSAPTWYWWCWGILIFMQIIKFGWSMYKKGQEK